MIDTEKIIVYRDKLEKGIEDYMEMPLSQRSAEAVESMVECLHHIEELMKCHHEYVEFTREDAEEWCEMMQNEDGSVGGHWTIDETNSVGKPAKVDDYVWNCAMNMIYSDFCGVFQNYGVGTAQFYSDVAKAFLFDEDAPSDKLGRYFKYIVE